jgi:hypothetical protein
MYVKVNGPQHALFQVGDTLQWGCHFIEDGRQELGDIHWHDELKDVPPLERLHASYTTGPVGTNTEGNPLWYFRYAFWYTPTGWEGVVTDSEIYSLGDNGKTIDKVT